MCESGLDWENTAYDCALVDNSLGRDVDQADTWADLSGASTAFELFTGKAITTTGAAAADPVVFNSVTPTDPVNGFFTGFVIKRNSDDSLIAWFDEGINNIDPGGAITGFVGVKMADQTVTFTVRPGINNEFAWFRP